jgi:hypothetical protein
MARLIGKGNGAVLWRTIDEHAAQNTTRRPVPEDLWGTSTAQNALEGSRRALEES